MVRMIHAVVAFKIVETSWWLSIPLGIFCFVRDRKNRNTYLSYHPTRL